MANTSIVTQEMLQDTLQNYHENLVYPYLNGATHTGCVPLGTVIEILGSTVPTHFLKCDGTIYNINEYSNLANFFEDQFGSKNYYGGDGTTTFAVPTFTATQTGAIVVIAATNAYIDLALDSFPLGISNPTDGQALVWNGTEGRWKNAGILHEYSTDEHVVGTWIDGRPLYEKTYVDTTHRVFRPNSQSVVMLETDSSKQLRSCDFGIHASEDYGGYIVMPMTPIDQSHGTVYFTVYANHSNSGQIRLVFSWASGGAYTVDEIWATYRYTKTTD